MELELQHHGETYRIQAQVIQDQLWFHFQGRTFVFDHPQKKSTRRVQSAGTQSNEIAAPMPGKVTKILKKLGDSVQVGDPVLVMEAMKMEYTLKSETKGSVTSIQVQVGDQVSLGQVLARMDG